jgi:hypothetical protein
MPVIIDGTNGITQAGEFNSDSSFGFKNRIINGAMVIDQRALGTVTVNSTVYTTDRWQANQTAAGKYSVANSTTAPAGFTNSFLATSLSAYSVGSSDIFFFQQNIEGYNVADLGWGTVNAKTITLSFWVRSSLTGTFGGALANSAHNRSYPFSYTILSANTYEQKSVTITGDTTGTWLTDNGTGIQVIFGLGGGSTRSGTAGSWQASTLYTATGATSVVGTNGATFYITGVQLEVGSTATSFDYRPYTTEISLCQRYYYRLSCLGNTGQNQAYLTGVIVTSTQGNSCSTNYPVPMRSAATSSYNDLRVYDGSVAPAVTSLAATCSSYSTASLNIACSAGSFTVGRVALLIPNSASSYVDFSAEL